MTRANDQPTCGKGLAANAVLPRKLAALMGAMAAVLENHTRALPRNDADAEREREAYARLAGDQRRIAANLEALGAAMESYRDLPMGGHDYEILGDRKSRDVFAAFIAAEEDALALLQDQAREYRTMLEAMGAA
jgi:hypothetical protein